MNGVDPAAALPAERLQTGIYYRKGQRPAPCYGLLLLNVQRRATAQEAREAIATVWTMLRNLRRGIVQDLQPSPAEVASVGPLTRVPGGRLTCLLGFGARLFGLTQDEPLVSADVLRDGWLEDLQPLQRNGARTSFPSLPWNEAAEPNAGETDLAIQLIARTELAVNRAVVEVWKSIQDHALPLDIVTLYRGFNRDDRRSWIDFYDGVSNIKRAERRAALEVPDGSWMQGGTYMAFLRLSINLALWRGLPRAHQEMLVGRDKLSGCLLAMEDQGANEFVPRRIAGCPLAGISPHNPEVCTDPARMDTSQPGWRFLASSHIHRTNLNRGDGGDDQNSRIFRQGYEFLESFDQGKPRLGLNFVSFQRRLSRLTKILTADSWLGDANFGGREGGTGMFASVPLVSVLAGGYYAVPPRGRPFPGAKIF